MSEVKKLSVEDIQNIENVIGYTFKNKKLLEQAFTRRSYTNEHWKEEGNEVLEFYGDRALDITVTSYLAKKLGADDEEGRYVPIKLAHDFEVVDEGYLSTLRSYLVCKRSLAEKITALDLMKYLRTGANDKSAVDSIKEDLFEAICGAIAIDSDWDFNIIIPIITNFFMLEEDVQEIIDGPDYVQAISEWHDKKFHRPILVWYDDFLKETWYEARIYIDPEGQNLEFCGRGSTELEAKNDALLAAYRELFEEGKRFKYYPDDILDIFKPGWLEPSKDNAINIVQEMYQAHILFKLDYEFEQDENDKNGNPLWKGTVKYSLNEHNHGEITCGHAESKTEIKKSCALILIKTVFDEYHYEKEFPLD